LPGLIVNMDPATRISTVSTAEFPYLVGMFACSLVFSLAITPLLRSRARRWNLLDAPDGRRKHQTQAIPLVGGLAVLLAVFLSLAILVVSEVPLGQALVADTRVVALWGAVLVLAIVGLIDDVKGLRGRHKLIGQLVAIALLLNVGEIRIQKIELFGAIIDLGAFGSLLAVLWLVGCINAINLIDGMDGLLGSVGTLISLTIAVLSALEGQWAVALVAATLAGSLIGFLRYNLPPASVYLGDCGSMTVGLIVGTLSLLSSTKGQTAVTLAVPVALLILPIFDTFAAITRRKLTGRSIYTTDRGHLHHCLQRHMTRGSILFLLFGLGMITALGAVATAIWKNDLYAVLAAVTVIGALVLTRLFGHAEMNLIKERLAASFASFRQGKGADRSRELEVRLQGNSNWNLIWDQLTRKADELNLRTICLDVNAPAFHENYHARWDRFGTSEDDPSQWRTEMPLFLNGQVIGRLVAAGIRDRKSISEKLSSIIAMMEYAELGASQVTAHHQFPTGSEAAKSRPATEIDLVAASS
jgi:UDP-GlcNAc:undecaprenyl-phosphate GlcNAc-1-phosphate transferase